MSIESKGLRINNNCGACEWCVYYNDLPHCLLKHAQVGILEYCYSYKENKGNHITFWGGTDATNKRGYAM